MYHSFCRYYNFFLYFSVFIQDLNYLLQEKGEGQNR